MKRQLDSPDLIIFESALFRTVTTLVVGTDYLLLVDPNWLPEEIERIRAAVDRRKGDRACYLLFTHSDYDHIIGYGRFPDFTVIASQALRNQPKREDILSEIHGFDDQYYIERDYPISYPTVDLVVDKRVWTTRLGQDTYAFYQAPGHNDDGLIALNQDRGLLIVGDYLCDVEFPYVYDSVARYRRTLDTLDELLHGEDIRLLISGHGDHTDSRQQMGRRLYDARHYLDALEAAVRGEAAFDLDALFRRYRFPRVMASFHEENRKKMIEYVEDYAAR
ncbi:glyoxylase-like metal-dependent hydrolase (beta-lactamase superfamily II) [Neolewinella xylanilytica]|uniref:Glyoxylase-like metal-dependent hydrolase (Beta-lactamase superfamily II) n=1 Tax=Neolewinella xylanilytica TaxID=1514080 RepID=A0A2S6I3Q9_9BACT|nr:MBL fold metallo-hydrolase [Neolewinella xylanilytica]PPK85689.1 glyoxylase-like metal-dependent hydrolase (beta-lactamase superfamily II) [Neolewinella xylanilytica]